MKVTGGWKAPDAAGLGIEDAFTVDAEKIEGRWYFFFPKPGRPSMSIRSWNVPDDVKISGADFDMGKWYPDKIEKKITELAVRHDITKRILDVIFGSH
jgi:hypothetical protein